MYIIKVITTDFVANRKIFAGNRTEETTYSIDVTVTNVFIQAKETTGSRAIGSIAIYITGCFPSVLHFKSITTTN